jgi:hypothetical protein
LSRIRSRGDKGAGPALPAIPDVDAENPVLLSADTQIRWYDANSQRAKRAHFRLRTAQLGFAAAVPISQVPPAALGWRVTAAVLGGLVALAQGIDSLHHYGDNYVAWRATCQRLIRERQLFAAEAGPYEKGKDLKLLAANFAAIEGDEQKQWEQGQLAGGTQGGADGEGGK